MTTDLAENLKEFFHAYLRDQKGVSPNTIKNYRDSFKLLIAFIAAKRRGHSRLTVLDLDVKTILAFLRHLEDPQSGRGNCAQTRNRRLTAIHSFFRYVSLCRPHLQPHAKRVLAIPVKRAPPTPTLFLSRKELQCVLDQPSTLHPDGIRDLAMLIFLYNTGARAQEVADARLAWFDFPRRTVTITGKGNKQRTTPLWQSTVDLIRLYTKKHRRKSPIASDYLFINQRGGSFTRFGVRAIVKKYIQRAARTCPSLADKRLSTHSLRHTTASHLLESNVDPNVIKAWLGHASMSSTSRYLHADLSHKRRILDQFGPPQNVASSLEPKHQARAGNILDWLEDLSTENLGR
ncbi:integrase [bacterium]|nr:MAG: integrase [bacterium]